MNYKVLIVLLAAVGLSGCLHDDDDNEVSPDSLNGTWIQSCNVDEDNDVSDSQLVINGAEWILSGTLYIDTACTEPYISLRLETISVSGSEITLSNGTLATAIDHTTTGVFMTPKFNSTATAFNSGQLCGIVTWEVDKEEDVGSCADFSFILGETFYDIYKVENNRLYQGDDTYGSGDTPEERPTSLDYEDIYQRQ